MREEHAMLNRTVEHRTELATTSESQSLADRDDSNVDQFTETEDDVCGFGHKETKQPPSAYLVFTLKTVLISSSSLPEK
jgi:hypothetical protein